MTGFSVAGRQGEIVELVERRTEKPSRRTTDMGVRFFKNGVGKGEGDVHNMAKQNSVQFFTQHLWYSHEKISLYRTGSV